MTETNRIDDTASEPRTFGRAEVREVLGLSPDGPMATPTDPRAT